MEGSYSKVWRSRDQVPQEEYRFFVDGLMETIRHEIASCEEKAYDSLPLNDAATLLFFDRMQQVSDFANEVSGALGASERATNLGLRVGLRGAVDRC
jgi:26S proteasome regulatory subunit N12